MKDAKKALELMEELEELEIEKVVGFAIALRRQVDYTMGLCLDSHTKKIKEGILNGREWIIKGLEINITGDLSLPALTTDILIIAANSAVFNVSLSEVDEVLLADSEYNVNLINLKRT